MLLEFILAELELFDFPLEPDFSLLLVFSCPLTKELLSLSFLTSLASGLIIPSGLLAEVSPGRLKPKNGLFIIPAKFPKGKSIGLVKFPEANEDEAVDEAVVDVVHALLVDEVVVAVEVEKRFGFINIFIEGKFCSKFGLKPNELNAEGERLKLAILAARAAAFEELVELVFADCPDEVKSDAAFPKTWPELKLEF
jgi:hypothetical protein